MQSDRLSPDIKVFTKTLIWFSSGIVLNFLIFIAMWMKTVCHSSPPPSFFMNKKNRS